VFVGFSADQQRLDRMLRRMAGAEGGVRDALTRYTTALTGAYYFVPSLQALRRFAVEDDALSASSRPCCCFCFLSVRRRRRRTQPRRIVSG
jgi:deferrochelatase/peroxidase EfeB